MSHNSSYRRCCCQEKTNPCPCDEFEDCLQYLNNCCSEKLLCAIFGDIVDQYCPKEDSVCCSCDTKGVEQVICDGPCFGINQVGQKIEKTISADNSECVELFPDGIGGCCFTCAELNPDTPVLSVSGGCWDGICKTDPFDCDENNNVIPKSGSVSYDYVAGCNENIKFMYSVLEPSINGCCPQDGQQSFSIFFGLDEDNTNDDDDDENGICDDDCLSCIGCGEYIRTAIGFDPKPNCPDFNCEDIYQIAKFPNISKCTCCEGTTPICPEWCPDSNGKPCDLGYIGNEIVACDCPEGTRKVYVSKCIECDLSAIKDCCEVQKEGFNLIAWQFTNNLAACPSVPFYPINTEDPNLCCQTQIDVPEECACWNARYELIDCEWTFRENLPNGKIGKCFDYCPSIKECMCTNDLPGYTRYLTDEILPFPESGCDNITNSIGSLCCPCGTPKTPPQTGLGPPWFPPVLPDCWDFQNDELRCPSGTVASGQYSNAPAIPSRGKCCKDIL